MTKRDTTIVLFLLLLLVTKLEDQADIPHSRVQYPSAVLTPFVTSVQSTTMSNTTFAGLSGVTASFSTTRTS